MWPFTQANVCVAVLCTANVCRSPAAEALLRSHLKVCGVGRRIEVISAGTEVTVTGQPPDPRMLAIAREHGISLRGLMSSDLDSVGLERASRIWVMEHRHAQQVAERFPELVERVSLLDPAGEEIADPYFGNKAGVRAVYDRLDALCAVRAGELACDSG